MLKTCQITVSKPNRNSLRGFGSAREQLLWEGFEGAKASSERQSKAAGKVLRVLRGAEKGSRKLLGRF